MSMISDIIPKGLLYDKGIGGWGVMSSYRLQLPSQRLKSAPQRVPVH